MKTKSVLEGPLSRPGMTRRSSLHVYLLATMVCVLGSTAIADYAEVLSKYVDKNGMVNYAELQTDRKPLDEYIRSLENPNTEGWVDSDWIAFWINAYNARTLQVIIDNYPTKGIRKIPGAWKKLTAPVLGKDRTLDEIEHRILRIQYKEPRIHMALVCAAYSCPKLRNEPYVGSRLDEQLDNQSRDFLSRPDRFKVKGNTVFISQIFKWFKRDFESIPDFIQQYSGQDISGLKIKYQRYDWSLNEQKQE